MSSIPSAICPWVHTNLALRPSHSTENAKFRQVVSHSYPLTYYRREAHRQGPMVVTMSLILKRLFVMWTVQTLTFSPGTQIQKRDIARRCRDHCCYSYSVNLLSANMLGQSSIIRVIECPTNTRTFTYFLTGKTGLAHQCSCIVQGPNFDGIFMKHY